MLTSERKKTFLEGWIKLVGSEGKTQELHDDLYQLLLNDTHMSGKLYKYRSFDKKRRSLKSLKTGTLYCAYPDSFNDPFDCKIGVTLSALAQAILGPVFEVTNDIIEVFLGILNGENTIEKCSKDEQLILNKLFANKKLMSFIEENSKEQIPDTEKAKQIKKNPTILVEILEAVMDEEFLAPILGPVARMVPIIMERITNEGLMVMLTQEPTYETMAQAMGLNVDADEIDLSLQISEKLFPEQEKEREVARRILDNLEQQLVVQLNKRFRVGCLCTDFKDTLMWSHYADSHKGFCVEYDFSRNCDSTQNDLPMPVVYSDSRPQIPWKEALHRSVENTASATADLVLGVLTKDKRWEYENEWRFLIPATMDPNLQMPPISCIYLGAMISHRNRVKILRIAKKLGIPVKQMVVDRGAYALHPTTITD